jgi:acyl-CoA synthetase (AMP-forming)/AMP-acid ligase II
MKGYHNDTEATKEVKRVTGLKGHGQLEVARMSIHNSQVLSEDGWLTTGDVGYVDEEGYVYIVDREKDVIR